MFYNYLTTAYRNLRRHKAFSLINILGLAIGMAACIFIWEYVSFEQSYDRFHPDAAHKYRIISKRYNENQYVDAGALTLGSLGPEIQRTFPEVKDVTRTYNNSMGDEMVLNYNDRAYKERVFVADANFLTFFGFQLPESQAREALREPNAAYVSESLARKLFGTADPLGKVIRLYGMMASEMHSPLLEVKGVFPDLPANAHLAVHCVISIGSLNNTARWGAAYMDNYPFYTYVQLVPGADPKRLAQKLTERYGESSRESRVEFELQALTDIHLYSNVSYELSANGNATIVYFLRLVGGIVLLIAWLNYINLATARSLNRAKEVGIRKIAGASRPQVIGQLMVESLLLSIFAVCLSLTLVQALQQWFNGLVGKPLELGFLAQSYRWLPLAGLISAGTVMAALYPAVVLSAFRPLTVLKPASGRSVWGVRLRQSLVLLQFSVSTVLVIVTGIVYFQLQHVRSRDLGMNPDQILIIQPPGIFNGRDSLYARRYASFRTELLRQPAIRQISVTSTIPGRPILTNVGMIRRADAATDEKNAISFFFADEHFIQTYGLRLVAGRNFRLTDEYSGPEGMGTDNKGAILNETAVRVLGFNSPEDAIGQMIYTVPGPRLSPVIGVVKDFHQQSLKKNIDPILLQYTPADQDGYPFSVKLSSQSIGQTLQGIAAEWKNQFPGAPLDYFFLDEFFNNQYQADRQFGQIAGIFSGLAIFVACLGLSGLAAFSAQQRTKEIGVRKVLGASVGSILQLLSKDFLRVVFLANLIAWPLAWWLMNRWLQNYAFSIQLNAWFFLIPAVFIGFISLLTISLQTLKAARANPVDSLRNE